MVTQALGTTRPEDAPSGVRFTAAAAMEAKDKLIVNFILSFTGAPRSGRMRRAVREHHRTADMTKQFGTAARMHELFSLANGEQ